MSITYRPEIDGLRALAVLSVLGCHAGFAGFAGGYVGVDVFFVISGFLITSLISADLKAGTFSFLRFWERRIRRIIPPLLLVLAATLIAGWFLHLAADYDLLGQQLAAQSVFSSNILFKSQAGYFEAASVTKPLLHTWSLSVEEQFYIFFPLAMAGLWRFGQGRLIKSLAVFAAISCIWAAIIVHNSPSSAFYLLPFRAWELLLGSLLALKAGPWILPARMKEATGIAGLLCILVPVLFYDEKTLFPGMTALLPCLGAAAIILSNQGGLNCVGRVLAMKVPVFIGLISYSLYLWHWPIISFARYSEMIPFTDDLAWFCLLFSLFLSILTWKYVETPVRRKLILPKTRQAYGACLGLLVLFAVIGLGLHFGKGIPSRLPEQVVRYAEGVHDRNPQREFCNKPKFERFDTDDLCQTNPDKGIKPTFVLWGDSFADAVTSAFYELSNKHGLNGYSITAHGCPPILEFRQRSYTGFDCPVFNDKVLGLIERHRIKHVYLVGNWSSWIMGSHSDFRNEDWLPSYDGAYPDKTMKAIQHTIDVLQARNIQVYFMLDVPFSPQDPPRYLAMKSFYGRDDLPVTFPDKSYLAMRREKLDPLVARNKRRTIMLDPYPYLCKGGECRIELDGYSLYFNNGHLSMRGAGHLNPLFEPYIRKSF